MDHLRRRSRPVRAARTVQARAVSLILARAEAEGLSGDALLEAAGFDRSYLADPDAPLPLGFQVALWQVIARATADPGFGVRTGASGRVREYGLLGYAICFSETLGAALRRLIRYHHILTDAVQLSLTASDDDHVAVVEEDPSLGVGLPFAVDSRLASIVAGCREITGVDLEPASVDFSYNRPASVLEHRRFFRSPLRFDQPMSRVVFRKRDLLLPLTHSDESLAGYLSDHAEHTLATLTAGGAFRDDVRSALWALIGEGPPTLRRVAEELRVPARTLQRRLARVSTSLTAELERIRHGMATAALRDRSRPVEEIAFLLGYREPSTFYRSFRRWTGMTPHEYRVAKSGAVGRSGCGGGDGAT